MEEIKCFCYTFSKETTEQILDGNAFLAVGGAKSLNGKMLEHGRPMVLSSNLKVIDCQEEKDTSDSKRELQRINSNLDLYSEKIDGLKNTMWLNYAATQQLCGITVEGFRQTLIRLDEITNEIRTVGSIIENKSTNEHLEFLLRYKNNMNSDSGFMMAKRFDVMGAYAMIVQHLDEISAYIARVEKGFLEGSMDGRLACCIISGLAPLFSYVTKRYSVLYYYENDSFPANFDVWVGVIKNILSRQFSNRLLYLARLEEGLSLEEKHIACKNAMDNIASYMEAISFEKEYALCHEKEEYLSIEQQLQDKLENNEYDVLEGHLIIDVS